MNRHALAVLQYPEALEIVAGYASSPLGAEAVRALEPSDARGWIELELRRVEEMATYLRRGGEGLMRGIPDVRVPLRRLAVPGVVWDGAVLRDVGELLETARVVRAALQRAAAAHPLLAEIAERLTPLPAEEEAVQRAIDEGGEVRDNASKELARLRREIRGARGRIVARLEQFMASLPERIRVPDASVSVREGRYVIPVRREGRAEVGGIVHDESASGGTLFIEPPVAIELMNQLRELERAEAREVQRILAELTDRFRPHREALEATLEALVSLDSLYARARYALRHGGARPDLLPAGTEEYVVVEGYHPILQATVEGVVPFDLTLGPGERTLLVSGPNTGGKTVLLKAIGLISALAQAGIIPPVGPGSRLPVFRDIFADIGDEQSIAASLSTFSAHLKHIREILEEADHEALVLIDEIGSGTDPAEGGALAQAVLVELTRRGALTVATTHLGQLKLLGGEEPGVVNASLQFDSSELRPTYRLSKGIPGRSYGLAIARRLGLPESVLSRAEAFLPQAERDVSQLILELEEKERRLAEALAEAEAARGEALALRQELEAREEALRRREREAERRARQQARDILLAAREEVEAAIRSLREAVAAGASGQEFEDAARQARRRVEGAAKRQAERMPREKSAGGRRASGLELVAGGRARVVATGAVGTVVELRDGRATVEVGGLRFQVPTSGLEPLPAAAEDARASTSGATSGRGGGWTASEVTASPEVDLRGLRAEEVAAQLEPALDAAFRADLSSLRIIHGKGTGVLRQVVGEILRRHPYVKSFRLGGPGEGGVGVTVAELA